MPPEGHSNVACGIYATNVGPDGIFATNAGPESKHKVTPGNPEFTNITSNWPALIKNVPVMKDKEK